ncbi:MAG: hypothetical protein BRD24_01095 [Halobacteriales archaeon SW_9_67_24]|nr:MAG: hypothetical protein BRD24_01095 [Halobacteriales archaeon SW_9_67_24]
MGWPAIQLLGLQGLDDPYPRPEWFFWVGRTNPINAYVKLTTLFEEFEYGHPLISTPGGRFGPVSAGETTVNTIATSHWFAAVVLLAWTLLAPIAGLLYFRDRDVL